MKCDNVWRLRVTQHCPNDTLQNHMWVKDPFRLQDRPAGFNIRK